MLVEHSVERHVRPSLLRVAVDYRPVEQHRSGIARYVSELLQRLASRPDIDLSLLSGDLLSPVQHACPNQRFDQPELRFRVPFPFKKIVRVCYTEPRFSAALGTMDIVWGTNYTLPGAGRSSCKRILTIHDMAWTKYPDAVQGPMLRILSSLADQVHSSDRVLVVSEATKQDLIRYCRVDSQKVRVIYNGVSERFHPLSGSLEAVRERYGLPKRFVLFVGTVEPRKNLARLVEAFNHAAGRIEQSLVVVGAKGWKTSPIYQEISRSPVRDRIHVAGFVPDEDLPAVYNLADAFMYPSLYEGFGIPVVEAMACGIPVVTSDVSSLPEVAGDAALLVDPLDTARLAEAMERIVHDHAMRAALRAKGLERAKRFSWDASAAQVVQCFRELCP